MSNPKTKFSKLTTATLRSYRDDRARSNAEAKERERLHAKEIALEVVCGKRQTSLPTFALALRVVLNLDAFPVTSYRATG